MSQLAQILRNQLENVEQFGDLDRIREWEARAER